VLFGAVMKRSAGRSQPFHRHHTHTTSRRSESFESKWITSTGSCPTQRATDRLGLRLPWSKDAYNRPSQNGCGSVVGSRIVDYSNRSCDRSFLNLGSSRMPSNTGWTFSISNPIACCW